MRQGTASDLLTDSERFLTETQRNWLRPLDPLSAAMRRMLYGLNWIVMKMLFRIRVVGREHLPRQGAFIIAPNHASSLDPFVLASAMPYHVITQTYWAGLESAVLRSPIRRFVNRLAHVIPIKRDLRALAVGAAILRRGHSLVWFPEGARSKTGELQGFKPGIGLLMDHFGVPAIPIYVENAFENLPPDALWPKHFRRITISFGEPVWPRKSNQTDTESLDRAASIASEIRDEVVAAKAGACTCGESPASQSR